MDYVRFGKTGMKVSRLCLGCMTYGSTKWRDWVLEEDAARPFFREALERGINFFDTADVYSLGVSEEITGRALKSFAKRHEVVLATKVHGKMGDAANSGGLSRKHIMEAIDHSLKRLGTDYVDLYQIHRFDPATPMEETLEALNDVVRAGKALYVGASSMYAWQFAQDAGDFARARARAVRLDAEFLQPRLSRGGARDDAALRRRGDRGDPVVADSARLSRRLRRRRRTPRPCAAARDAFSVALGLGSAQDEEIRLRVVEVARDLGLEAGGGGARLGAVEAVSSRRRSSARRSRIIWRTPSRRWR